MVTIVSMLLFMITHISHEKIADFRNYCSVLYKRKHIPRRLETKFNNPPAQAKILI